MMTFAGTVAATFFGAWLFTLLCTVPYFVGQENVTWWERLLSWVFVPFTLGFMLLDYEQSLMKGPTGNTKEDKG